MKPKPTPAAARPPLVFNLPALCARAYLQHLAGNSKPGKRLEPAVEFIRHSIAQTNPADN